MGSAPATRDARKFRKRPVVVEALQFAADGSNWRECCLFLGDDGEYPEPDYDAPPFLDVETLHGVVDCEPGDWIVRGPSGDFWPVKADIFEESYEPHADLVVDESASRTGVS